MPVQESKLAPSSSLRETRFISSETSQQAAPVRLQQRERSLKTACLCAKIAAEYRGIGTVVLDLTAITPVFDFFVITTGTSKRQMKALAGEVKRVLKEGGTTHLGQEGDESGVWLLQDYGDVVLHIFSEESRSNYDLEHLWADAKRIDWQKGRPFAEEGSSMADPTNLTVSPIQD
ncbi:MAG: ribosome silencing factor [Planctomycetes bacterium]|nr:ribosome silencing factor [Planctomycetota bacterium]